MRRKSSKKQWFFGLVAASFVVYITLASYLLFFRVGGLTRGGAGVPAMNLVPFYTIYNYGVELFRTRGSGVAVMNLAGNLLLLLPLGFYLPFFVRRLCKFGWFLFACTVLIVVIEGAQLLTGRGSLDVDDFILNVAGAAVGFWMFHDTPLRRLRGESPLRRGARACTIEPYEHREGDTE